MSMFNMHEAKTNLSRLVEQAKAGEEIIIAQNGKPAVKLVKADDEPLGPRPLGLARGKIFIDVPDDFDDEDEEVIKLFYDGEVFPDSETGH